MGHLNARIKETQPHLGHQVEALLKEDNQSTQQVHPGEQSLLEASLHKDNKETEPLLPNQDKILGIEALHPLDNNLEALLSRDHNPE